MLQLLLVGSGAAALRAGGHDPGAAVRARQRQRCSCCSCRRSGACSLTNALDQGLRFSLDKATYELLYLPLAPAQRAQVKTAIDIVISRVADAAGAVLLGVATEGS